MGGHDGQEGARQASGIVHSPEKGDEGSVHTESVKKHGTEELGVGCVGKERGDQQT